MAVILGLLLLHAKMMHLFTDKSYIAVLVEFWVNRIGQETWQSYEIKGTIAFIGLLVAIAFGTIIGYKKFLKMYIKKYRQWRLLKSKISSKQGTAEWTDESELKKLCGDDGVIIGYKDKKGRKEIRLSLKSSCEHVAVIGPTGCGKSTKFFVPNILELPKDTSVILTDPKGELKELTGEILKSRGYRVTTINPLHPEESSIYNPLDIIENKAEISDIAEITLRNGYGEGGEQQWISFSLPLWEACLLAEYKLAELEERAPTIQKAYRIITNLSEESRGELFKTIGGEALEVYSAYVQSIQAPETAASIKTVVTSALKVFTRPDIKEITSKKGEVIFKEARKQPSAIFIQIPEHKSDLFKPFSATLYWQMLEHLYEHVGLPIIFFLDEFANIGEIPGFSKIAATVRSRKISLCIGLQGTEQLGGVYSDREKEDILNNMKTKIFFPGSTGESGTFANTMAGYSTVKANEHLERRELITPDELRRIPDDKVLVIAHNLNPVLLDTVPYYKNKKLLEKHNLEG